MGGVMQGDERSKESFWTQLKSFGSVYWIANWIELVERFAYYGVRVVLPVFMVLAAGDGGPQLDHRQKGTIFAVWAIVQSFVPILSGGFADRYGYKINIALATVLKIFGYLLMGYSVHLAELLAGMPLAEARAAGSDLAYELFFSGAMLLAFGTAIFKPGVQGLIANQMPKGAESLGWGLFYQMVNIGGFVGPLLAGYLRVLDWTYVFLLCSAGIALNFIPLFFFKEPAHVGQDQEHQGPMRVMYNAMRGLLEPRLFFFTIAFAGFWLMFFQLFDILPNFIDDWVDSRGAASALKSIVPESWVPTINEGNLTQEWIINLNALLISLLAFAVGYVTGKVRALNAIIVGIAISAGGIYMLGLSLSGWWILLAIAIFSVGEMSASPTKMRYLASLAPPGKAGLYMGYTNFTVGIGWSIGSIVAGNWYEEHGDKINLAKKYLVEKAGVTEAALKNVDRGDLMAFFEKTVGVDAWKTRELLWEAYEPQSMWLLFMVIGVCSMAAIMLYTFVVRGANANPAHPLNTRGSAIVKGFLIPITGLFLYFTVTSYLHMLTLPADQQTLPLGLALNTVFFGVMTAIAFVGRDPAPEG
ncbi:MAG: hypothetical protein AMXMBFR64_57120 [Myxococcales bacterium]